MDDIVQSKAAASRGASVTPHASKSESGSDSETPHTNRSGVSPLPGERDGTPLAQSMDMDVEEKSEKGSPTASVTGKPRRPSVAPKPLLFCRHDGCTRFRKKGGS